MNKNKYWFPALKYGYGWGLPCSWQGWALTLIYLSLLTSGAFFISEQSHLIYYVIFSIFITALFISICYLKGEKPSLNWGVNHAHNNGANTDANK